VIEIADGPWLDIEAIPVKRSDRARHVRCRGDEEPALTRLWLDRRGREDGIFVRVARTLLDQHSVSVDAAAQQGENVSVLSGTGHNDTQMLIASGELTSLAQALFAPAQNDGTHDIAAIAEVSAWENFLQRRNEGVAHGAKRICRPAARNDEGKQAHDWCGPVRVAAASPSEDD